MNEALDQSTLWKDSKNILSFSGQANSHVISGNGTEPPGYQTAIGWSILSNQSLASFPQPYFQIILVPQGPKPYGPQLGFIIGIASSLPSDQLPGIPPHSYGYSWGGDLMEPQLCQNRQKGPICGQFAIEDVIGCGLDNQNRLFWTRNDKLFLTNIRLSPNTFYPAIGFTAGTDFRFKFSTEAPILRPKFEGKIWDISYPFGKAVTQPPIKQDFKLLDLPLDVLRAVLGYVASLLTVSVIPHHPRNMQGFVFCQNSVFSQIFLLIDFLI